MNFRKHPLICCGPAIAKRAALHSKRLNVQAIYTAQLNSTSAAMYPEPPLATLYEDDLKGFLAQPDTAQVYRHDKSSSFSIIAPSKEVSVPGGASHSHEQQTATAPTPEYDHQQLPASPSSSETHRLAIACLYETSSVDCASPAHHSPWSTSPFAQRCSSKAQHGGRHLVGRRAASPRFTIEWPSPELRGRTGCTASNIWDHPLDNSLRACSATRSEIRAIHAVTDRQNAPEAKGQQYTSATATNRHQRAMHSQVVHDEGSRALHSSARPAPQKPGQYCQDNRALFAQIRAAIDAIGSSRGERQRCVLGPHWLLCL